jgi:hypothetical protein
MSLITETQLKLHDANIQLNLAVENINKEDVFRSCINSFVTLARSVTFVMQKESAPHKGLTKWYEQEMSHLKSLPLMKFFHDQRTHTVHRGIIKPNLRTINAENLLIDGEKIGRGIATIWLFIEAKEYMPNRSGGVIKLCEEYFLILNELVNKWLEVKRVVEGKDEAIEE